MTVEILEGHVIDRLKDLPDESIHCCLTSPPYWGLRSYIADDHPDKPLEIGLEETPDEWCARLVEVFREVKRVLRKDGTLFCNVGDAYQDKQLIGQPWLLAFALRADGWFLRDAIVWNKPNPMPESVKDRCTNAYEHVFLLARDKRYFFDADAIKEQAADSVLSRSKYMTGGTKIALNGDRQDGDKGQRTSFADYQNGRNCRNVWTIATEAFSGSHFAVFPTELARRCILAGTSSKGVCAECGAPWERVIEPTGRLIQQKSGAGEAHIQANGPHGLTSSLTTGYSPEKATTGWHPSCQCDADLAQATVLDPFGGAGTTGLVADRLQRNSVLIELNAEYAAMARKRIDGDRGDLLDLFEQPKPEQGSLCLVP